MKNMTIEEAIEWLNTDDYNTAGYREAISIAIETLEKGLKPRKPPLGIKPRRLHEKQRLAALVEAIKRYAEADFPIPDEWWEEYEELKRKEIKQDE